MCVPIINISNKGSTNLSTLVTYAIPSKEDYLSIFFFLGRGGDAVGRHPTCMNTHFSKNVSENSPNSFTLLSQETCILDMYIFKKVTFSDFCLKVGHPWMPGFPSTACS